MCGRYFIAPEEEGEDWEEIMAILQRRGEAVKTGEIFPADTVPVIANSRSMRPTPFAMRWRYPAAAATAGWFSAPSRAS